MSEDIGHRYRSGRVLMISQVFVPDSAAVGQHMADVAQGIAEASAPVLVLTANRGYDDPGRRFERRTLSRNLVVKRVPFSSFGKRNLLVRLLAQVSFVVQCTFIGLFSRRIESLFVTTSPPLGGVAALVIGTVRRLPITYWVMDMNPDQAVAAGKVKPGAPVARLLDWANRRLLRMARHVIVLDEYMESRLIAKEDVAEKLAVVPPWEVVSTAASTGESGFGARCNPDGRFVVMYSGNHSLVHPLGTLLKAAERLADRRDLRFLFVGGGLGKRDVEDLIARTPGGSIASIPYQPLELLGETLAVGDVHAVTMGDAMVGLVHPSKVYGALAVGRPVLYIGPRSHISDMIEKHEIGWHFNHGDSKGVESLLIRLLNNPGDELYQKGMNATKAMELFDRLELRQRVVDLALSRY